MEGEIINRVAKSPLVTIDLEAYYPEGERVVYDLKQNLFQELILREKDFREQVKAHDWSGYQGKHVAVHCSVDSIIPLWAFMLIAINLEPYAQTVVFGDLSQLEAELFKQSLNKIDPAEFVDKKVVIKGCSNIDIPTGVYMEIARMIRPHAASIMYGEPCSTVPLYKKRRK